MFGSTHLFRCAARAVAAALLLPATAGWAVDVANIAAAKALYSGSDVANVTITGAITITAERSQVQSGNLAAQDASSALHIYDGGSLLADLKLGDNVTGLTGTVSQYQGRIEFLPTAAGTVVSHNNAVTPLEVTAATDVNTIADYSLIRVNGISINTTDANWSGSYTMVAPVIGNLTAIYVYSGSAANGTPIPSGTFDMIGIMLPYSGAFEIVPRLADDVIPGSGAAPDPALSVTPTSSLNFDPVGPGGSAQATITLENIGAAKSLHIDAGTAISGPGSPAFTITSGIPQTIAPGASGTLGVRFDAGSALGLTSATLAIHGDSEVSSVTRLQLNGLTAHPLPIYEGFDYGVGRLSALSQYNWNPFSSAGIHPVSTLDTASDSGKSLSLAGMPGSAGRRVEIQGVSGESLKVPFSTAVSSGSIYYSLLLKVTDATWTGGATGQTNSSVIAGLNKKRANGSETTQGGLRIIQSAAGTPNKYNLGITLNSYQNADWVNAASASSDLNFNQTYLVVVKYTIGSPDDTMTMWIDPNPGATAEGQGAAQTLTYTTPTSNDHSLAAGEVLNGFVLSQQYYAGAFTAEVDEVRVARTYADALKTGGKVVNAVRGWTLY